jgi:hypothetical protein
LPELGSPGYQAGGNLEWEEPVPDGVEPAVLRLVADTIAGQTERFDVFTRLQHRHFPGGTLLRTPTLVLAMLWYRLRDLL